MAIKAAKLNCHHGLQARFITFIAISLCGAPRFGPVRHTSAGGGLVSLALGLPCKQPWTLAHSSFSNSFIHSINIINFYFF